MRSLRLAALALVISGCSGEDDKGNGGGCPEPSRPAENGRALLFEGGHVAIDAEDLFQALPDGTLEAWVRRDGGGDRVIAGRKSSVAQAPAFALYADGSDPAFGIGDVVGGWDTSIATAGELPIGTWTHIAIAWSNTAISFVLDGEALVNTSVLTGPVPDSTGALEIGGGLGFVGESWDGAIDEVRLWGWAKEPGEVDASRNVMLSGAESGLIAAWNFEEGEGTAVADLAIGCHTGRITGGDATFVEDVPF